MSEDARELYRQPREDDETRRLRTQSPRFCALCDSFGDHHTDRHPSDDDEAVGADVAAQFIGELRRKLRGDK